MNPSPGSLDNLRDIVAPEPVSWWPPAPGWWLVAFLVLTVATAVAHRFCRQWQRNAYRRAALRAIEQTTSIAEVSDVLKRAALAAYPRPQVASLAGDAWCEWLEKTGREQVPPQAVVALTQDVYAGSQAGDLADVRQFAISWIRSHDPTHELKGDAPGHDC